MSYEYVVRACKSYPALVAALREMEYRALLLGWKGEGVEAALKQARNALILADGGDAR